MRFGVGEYTLQVNIPSQALLLQEVTRRFSAGDGFAVATLNLDHLVKLSQSDVFQRAYAAQDLVVADGNPIVWLSRLAGTPVELVPGSELIVPLAQRAAASGIDVGLVGTTEVALAKAAVVLEAEIPGLSIVAKIAPAMGFDPVSDGADEIFAELDVAGARLVFLALGAPKQECLAARGREVVPHMGFASIGAGLDFLAGTQTRAPVWVRKLALEWLWRMLSNPGRLFWRYAQCFGILPRHLVAALRQRRSGGQPPHPRDI
ncbi:MAG: WecB/TagA/CpsF family glycosyltransferase [Marinovum sp.]|nr:WecB/TagA/CpsF family glycosyltransferase [Marinovum sp.]